MESANIDYVTERKSGELHGIVKTAEGAQSHVALTDIRGAVAPPTANFPGYWLLLATRYGVNDSGKPVHIFLKEGEKRNHQHLLNDVSEAVGKYRAREIYCPECCGLFSMLVKKFWDVQGVSVRPSPNEADIDFGISLIIGALEDETLEIPRGTIIYGQLEQMAADALEYTLHPLRFLLSAFQMYVPRRSVNIQTVRSPFYYG